MFNDEIDIIYYYKDLYKEKIYETGVYKIWFVENPEYFYIGMASRISKFKCNCGFYDRWKRHLRDFRNTEHKNTFMQNLYNKYSFKDIRFEILELCTKETCIKNEMKWFDILKPPTNFQGNKNFKHEECIPDGIKNRGVRKNFKHSDETKLKMSKSQIGRIYVPKEISNSELDEIIEYAKNGDTLTRISKNIKKSYEYVKKYLLIYMGEEEFIKLKEKSYLNSRNKINIKNKLRKIDKNEKYKSIIPVILELYRSGLTLKQISKKVFINDDLVSVLIKMNMDKTELKSIKSNNYKRI